MEEARVSVDSKSYIEAELREQLTDLLICFDRPAGDSTNRAGGVAHATDSRGGLTRRVNRERGQSSERAGLYLYVLVEHKSQPEHWTTFQLLRYMLAVWSDVLRREGPEPQRLPPILPVVLYQGARQWNSPRTFEALIESAGEEVPGERPAVHIPRHIPRFEPLFVNLQNLPDEHFHGGVRAVVALLFLKYLARRIDRRAARVLLDAMHREGVTRDQREYYQAFYTAFLQTKSAEEIDIFIAEAARRRYHDSEEDLMTYAEELKTEGRREGRQEGLQEGLQEGRVTDKQDVLIRQLSRKFGLTDAERQRIRGVEDTERLDAALDELVVAETKEAVLEKLG